MEKKGNNRFESYVTGMRLKENIEEIVFSFSTSKLRLLMRSLAEEGLMNLIFDKEVINFVEQDYYKKHLNEIFPRDIVEGSLIQWVMLCRDPKSIEYTEDILIVRLCFMLSVLIMSCRGLGTVDENYFASYLAEHDEEMSHFFVSVMKKIEMLFKNRIGGPDIRDAKASLSVPLNVEQKCAIVNHSVDEESIEEVPYVNCYKVDKSPLVFPCFSSGIVRVVCDRLEGDFFKYKTMYERIRGVNKVLTRYSDIKHVDYYGKMKKIMEKCEHGYNNCPRCVEISDPFSKLKKRFNMADVVHAKCLMSMKSDSLLRLSRMGLTSYVSSYILDRMIVGLRRFCVTYVNDQGEIFCMCKCRYFEYLENVRIGCRNEIVSMHDCLSGNYHRWSTSFHNPLIKKIIVKSKLKFYEIFELLRSDVFRRETLDELCMNADLSAFTIVGEFCVCEGIWRKFPSSVDLGRLLELHERAFLGRIVNVELAVRDAYEGTVFFALKGDFIHLYYKTGPEEYELWC